jgi:hypothetical protein
MDEAARKGINFPILRQKCSRLSTPTGSFDSPDHATQPRPSFGRARRQERVVFAARKGKLKRGNSKTTGEHEELPVEDLLKKVSIQHHSDATRHSELYRVSVQAI